MAQRVDVRSNDYGQQEELRDFRNFLWLIWRHLGLPDPTPVQYDIADYLQHGPRRMVVEAFRGVGKSWITAAFVLWCLYWNPQLKILVVSASKERADSFSIFCKRLITEVSQLSFLRPREGQRDSVVAFDVGPALADHAPSVKSVGITGQITGSRADIIIPDDIEVRNNSLTATMRERLGEDVKEFEAVLKSSEVSPARIIYLGTPQTEFSLYNELPSRGYDVRVWPARVPATQKLPSYWGRLAPFVMTMIDSGMPAGTPVDPTRFDDRDLIEREASYGRSGFAMQFMLDTTLSDAEKYPLKLADFIVMQLDSKVAPMRVVWGSGPDLRIGSLPVVGLSGDYWHRPMHVSKDWAPYQGAYMFIDPSGRGKDHTGYAVVKCLGATLYLTAAGGLSGGYTDQNLTLLATVAKEQQVNKIFVESNFGDGMYTKLLTPVVNRIHPCTIEEVNSTGQKELRIIDVLEPVLTGHRLVVDEKLIREDFKQPKPEYQLFFQLTRITKDRGSLRHEDVLEAVAGAVKPWIESMAVDADRASHELRQRALDDELARFRDTILGPRPKGNFFRL